jgi:CheY-like chemotaxis protein
MKILIVDDDPLIRELLQDTMRVSGFEDVVLAGTAVEAAATISEANPPFDCMFIDIRMPEIEGDYLCEWIRNMPAYSSIPLIMITALSNKVHIDRAFAAGATDYITKPIDISKFVFRLRLIDREINKGRSHKQGFAPDEEGPAASGPPHEIDFPKPFKIGGFKGELDISALENYVKLISMSAHREMLAFAFMIRDAAQIHQVLSDEGFKDILRATGEAISLAFKGKGFFLAYAGYGAFVGVVQGDEIKEADHDELEKTVQRLLDDLRIVLADETQLEIMPCMSPLLRLGGWHDSNVIDVLYRTIGEAEERCLPG